MPKIIQKFCYIDIEGGTYILHTDQPFLIGRVWMYKSIQALAEQIEKLAPLSYVQMETHSIAITLWAVLGDRLIVHSGTKEELKLIMNKMMEFFKESRFDKAKYYDKFRV